VSDHPNFQATSEWLRAEGASGLRPSTSGEYDRAEVGSDASVCQLKPGHINMSP
jgi:hypothetical protein